MRNVIVYVLLVLGVSIVGLCALGIAVMDDVFDRLHFTGPASIGAFLIAIAVLVDDGFSVAGMKAVLVAVLLAGINPILTHATARAARVRQFGHWVAMPEESVEG